MDRHRTLRGRLLTTASITAIAAGLATPALASTPGPAATGCPWVNSTAPIAQRVDQVLGQMTLDEKIQELHGAGGSAYVGHVPAIPRLCVPELNLEDGPGGVGDGMTGVTQLPAPISGAASWNTSLLGRYGNTIGTEQWGKGANIDLGPTVNIVRDPRWGRTFESYGEDPYLTGQLAAADINGIQGAGTLAQIKHLAVYNQETNRNTPADDAIVDDRTMHEIYLSQFESAIRQSQPSSVMCSYSTINGTYACQNPDILSTVLRSQWGYGGFVTSDWGATHSTVPSVQAGLDQEMPDDQYYGAALKQAVTSGQVSESTVDNMVRPILTQMFRFGLFTRKPTGNPSSVVTNPAHASVARQVAEQGTVLLKNAGGVLPLTAKARSIAVIGDDAGPDAMSSGGGSAAVNAPYLVTPLDAITQRAGASATVSYAQGDPADGAYPAVDSRYLTPSTGSGHGLTGQYYPNMTLSGSPTATNTTPRVLFNWHGDSPVPGIGGTGWSAKYTGTLTPPTTGTYQLSLTSDDGSRLYVNGKLVIDNWKDQAVTTKTGTVDLTANQPVSIEVDYYQNGGQSELSFGWLPPGQTATGQAADTAKSADVAVVFVSKYLSEGSDSADLSLSPTDNALISAVAAANPHTIVVLNTGSAVTMPWIDAVPGVFEAWYPGQEDGNAIAALLFGDVNPSGKLPVTFPASLSDVPASTPAQWPGVDGKVQYSEGLDVGYRWYDAKNIAPLFAFGSGLSYTTFAFGGLHVTPDGATVDVTNTGPREGADVVQLYVTDPASAGEPPLQLKGFQRIDLQPGQTRRVALALDRTAFQTWNSTAQHWQVVPGTYQISVGDASDHLPVHGTVTVTG